MFDSCEICGCGNWEVVYRGAVRDGAFGQLRQGASVGRCLGCHADRMVEDCCLQESDYESESYRAHLQQSLDTESFLNAHDEMQLFPLQTLWPMPLRGLTVADVGCAGGSFLDHVRGVARRFIAVEPCTLYHSSLAGRGYEVFSYADDAARELGGVADLTVTLQVIEHTRDPRAFLADIRRMLKPGGRLLVSTPNRNDFLMGALSESYPEFFYRVAHRWYFDDKSIARCAELAGFSVEKVRHLHRYSMSNALLWLRDRRPCGKKVLSGVNALGDDMWKSMLENTGQADCLYVLLRNGEPTP